MAVLAEPIQTTFTVPRQLTRAPTRMESTLQKAKVSPALRSGSNPGGHSLMETAAIPAARRGWVGVTPAARPRMAAAGGASGGQGGKTETPPVAAGRHTPAAP